MDTTKIEKEMVELPTVVMSYIGTHLDKHDRQNLRRVSKGWRDALDTGEFWKDRKVALHHMEFYSEDVWNNFSVRGITSVVLKATGKADHNRKLALVMFHLENLTHLEVDCVFLHELEYSNPCSAVQNNQVKDLTINLTRRHNDFHHKCAKAAVSQKYFPNVQHLCLVNSQKMVTIAWFQNPISKHFPHVEGKRISGTKEGTIHKFSLNECPGEKKCLSMRCKRLREEKKTLESQE